MYIVNLNHISIFYKIIVNSFKYTNQSFKCLLIIYCNKTNTVEQPRFHGDTIRLILYTETKFFFNTEL